VQASGVGPIVGGRNRVFPSEGAMRSTSFDSQDLAKLRELQSVKRLAALVLAASLALLVVAKLLERQFSGFGFLAAFAEASTIGGLADWYAVVVLFRRPLGLPIPHTAIIPANRRRIAEQMGEFIETHFLAPGPVAAKLRRIDFAAAMSEWLIDADRSDRLARFLVRLLPRLLTAVESSGLRAYLAQQFLRQIEELKMAPFAAGLLTAFTHDRGHQRILDEVLAAVSRLMTDRATLEAIRRKIRAELPTLLNFYRADKLLLKKIAAATFEFIEEVRLDENHPLRGEFDRFIASFIDKIESAPEYAERLETLKRELLADPRVADLAADIWTSFRRFLEENIRPNSALQAHVREVLIDAGRDLADDPRLRSHINRGMTAFLEAFVQEHKGGVAVFVADQVKSWDMDQVVRLLEINLGKDLQFVRFNGAIVGGLAGLALYAGQILLHLT
jgi:uncharacterized membrane-anchored protein YjiN (DUF445 family)